MEATKKKKAYLKPEMNRFEMKTEGFIAGSKEIVWVPDTPEVPYKEGFIEEHCTQGGVVKQMEIGETRCFPVNDNDVATCKLIQELGGVKNKDYIQITRKGKNLYQAELTSPCI